MGYKIVKSLKKGLSKMILNVILILMILKLSRCSLVLDSMSQNTLYVSNYCPRMKNCIEGSHVICQYYNHHRIVGQLCNNYVKLSITPQMVQQILEGVNTIRMKLATGEETGIDEQPLPRAYGMMRMHWDSELATLAQVLADQCLGLKEDNCRATDKFSNPSQIITLINFKAPNWEYLTRNSTERGLNNEKIRSSIDKAFKSLHAIKKLISTNDINKCPVLEILPDKGSRSYLKLIRGKATHIGCGISAYTRSQVLSSGSEHIYNSIQLVCNVSDGPVNSQPVYTADPPIPDTGFTEKCGCPEGYRDSTGCLCEKDAHGIIENTEIQWRHSNLDKYGQSYETEPCDNPDGICDGKPNVMVLPIFEIHDAPNGSYEPENDLQFHRRFGNASFIPTSMEENEISDDVLYPENESGFTKMHKNYNRNHEYRRAISSEQRVKEFNTAKSDEGTAEHYEYNHYPSMEDNILEHDPRKNSGYDDRMTANDVYRDHTEEETSFLEILDHLERAVKNIELDGEERKIFDFKMRKIYEAALKLKAQHESEELEDEFKKLTDYLKHKSDAELEDESIQSDKQEMFDYINRKDNYSDEFYNGIDENLIKILTKKHHHKDDYFSKHHNMDAHNNENDAYTNYPASRKQDNLNNYEKNLIKSNKRKNNVDNRNHKSLRTPVTESRYGAAIGIIHKKYYDDRQKKNTGDKRNINTINIDQAIKTFGRRTFTYPEHKARRIPISPRYRRIFETENERPTLPTTTQKAEKIKVEIIRKKKYLKRDRPIL